MEPFKPMPEENQESESKEYREVSTNPDEEMGNEQPLPVLDASREPAETTEEDSPYTYHRYDEPGAQTSDAPRPEEELAPTPPVIGGLGGWMLRQKAAEEQSAPTPPDPVLPPEAQGETNGGPLGCCFGVIVGLVLSLIIVILSDLYGAPLVHSLQGGFTIIVRILMGVVALVGVIIFGYLGWKIGKKVFREYEPPIVKDRSRKPKPRTRPKPKGI